MKTHKNFSVKKQEFKKAFLTKSPTKLGITIKSNINIQPHNIHTEINSFVSSPFNSTNISFSNVNNIHNSRLMSASILPTHAYNMKNNRKSLFDESNSIMNNNNTFENSSDNKKKISKKNIRKSPIRIKLKLMNKIIEKLNSNSMETGMFNLPLLSTQY
jgi:hypothetical protein